MYHCCACYVLYYACASTYLVVVVLYYSYATTIVLSTTVTCLYLDTVVVVITLSVLVGWSSCTWCLVSVYHYLATGSLVLCIAHCYYCGSVL